MGSNKPIKVLVMGPRRIASFEIGINQPFSLLQKQGFCEYIVMDEDKVRRRNILAADVVVFARTTKPQAYQCLEWAHAMNKRTVYVIDDHFLAMPQTTDIGKTFRISKYRRTFTRFLKNAQIVKVASPFFANHLKQHFRQKKIVCFPGSVNFSLLKGLKKDKKNDQKIIIGYAGGKKEEAFIPVIRAIKRVMRKQGDKVQVQFFGYIPSELVGCRNVIHIKPEQDYSNYLRRLYQLNWDIGLAPLEKALYHDCKTDNKFREYSACHIPGIYSDSPAYNHAVIDGKTGILVGRSHEDWYAAIKKMMEDSDSREMIRQNSSHLVKQVYTVEACAEHWKNEILHR